MKHSLKKLVSLVLVLAISLAISVPAFAAKKDNEKSSALQSAYVKDSGGALSTKNYLKPTTEFIEFIKGYFQNHNSYIVTDRNGNNISKKFYQDNLDYYSSANYYAIRVNMFDYVSCFSTKSVENTSNVQNGKIIMSATTKQNVSEKFYQIVSSDDFDHPFEIQYQISGSFYYNINTGIISSCSDSTLKLTYSNAGAMWSVALKDISTNSEMASDRYSVTFSAYFGVEATLGASIGKLPIGYTCDYGRYSNSVTGTPE